MSFKDEMNSTLSRLVELESGARELRNQNLADQIGHAIGRLKMACAHPDVDNVDRVRGGDKELAPEQMPTRENLDAQLAQLPGDYQNPDYVVYGMRAHYGALFTDGDEARVRDLVKPPAPFPPAAPHPEA